jgi:hypothetical protein
VYGNKGKDMREEWKEYFEKRLGDLKHPAHRAALPGKVVSFYIVPLDPAYKAGLTGHVPVKEEIIHQFHIISEDVITKVKQVAEGVVNLDQKFDRRLDGLDRTIDEKNQDVLAAIKFSYKS